jgi:hypothetical protein
MIEITTQPYEIFLEEYTGRDRYLQLFCHFNVQLNEFF